MSPRRGGARGGGVAGLETSLCAARWPSVARRHRRELERRPMSELLEEERGTEVAGTNVALADHDLHPFELSHRQHLPVDPISIALRRHRFLRGLP